MVILAWQARVGSSSNKLDKLPLICILLALATRELGVPFPIELLHVEKPAGFAQIELRLSQHHSDKAPCSVSEALKSVMLLDKSASSHSTGLESRSTFIQILDVRKSTGNARRHRHS